MELVQRWENPVLVKDLRTRMRGGKAFWLMAAYTGILLIAFGGWYAAEVLNAGNDPSQWNRAGKSWFEVMFVLQAVLVAVLMPAFTSGAFTLEHEQRTLELLLLTTLTPTRMVLGRWLSAFAFVALLLLCSIPFASICFMLGSVSPTDFIASYVSLLLTALLFGSLGLACSTASRRTAVATLLAYSLLFGYWGAMAVLSVSTLFAMGFRGGMTYSVFGALEPIQAALFSGESGRFFGGLVALWKVGFPIHLLLIWLLTTLAINNFPYHVGAKVGWLRLQTLLLFVVLTFCFAGAMWSPMMTTSVSSAREFASFVIAFALGFILLFIPIFCTKAIHRLPHEGLLHVLAGALNPVNLFRGKLRSAPLYVLLLIILTLPLLPLSFRFGGSSIEIAGSANSWQLYAILLTNALFYVALGIFCSLLFRPHRAISIVALYFLILSVTIIPPVIYAVASDALVRGSSQQTMAPLWAECVYLSPAMPIIGIAGDFATKPPTYFLSTRVPLGAWWLVNVLLYGFLTLALVLSSIGLFAWKQSKERGT
jgi:ABC-type transport system involved in multi-copper enzyme maturation permease subunit